MHRSPSAFATLAGLLAFSKKRFKGLRSTLHVQEHPSNRNCNKQSWQYDGNNFIHDSAIITDSQKTFVLIDHIWQIWTCKMNFTIQIQQQHNPSRWSPVI